VQFSVFFADPATDPHGTTALAQSKVQTLPLAATASMATGSKR
jgi:hypothetical protein